MRRHRQRALRFLLGALVVGALPWSSRAQVPVPAGASVAVIQIDSMDLTGIATLSELLSSRVPGVLVQQSGGVVGTGARIRIRGIDNYTLPGDPLLVIGGTQANGATASGTLFTSEQPSRLDDVAVGDIERIEILRGPAAASLYGMGAANGVILVTTKRGHAGAPRWTTHADVGRVSDVTAYPANYSRASAGGGDCTLGAEATRACTPVGGLLSFNPLEQVSPFRDGLRASVGASLSGGGRRATYYVSGGYRGEQGVLATNDLDRVDFHASSSLAARDNLSLRLTASYLASRTDLPPSFPNFILSRDPIARGLRGSAVDDVDHGYRSTMGDESVVMEASQRVHRLTGGVDADWRFGRHWVSTSHVGVDRLQRDETLHIAGATSAFRNNYDDRRDDSLGDVIVTAESEIGTSYTVARWLRGSTSVGVRYVRDRTTDDAHHLVQSQGVPGGGSGETSRQRVGTVDRGFHLTQSFVWRDAWRVDASVRSGHYGGDEFASTSGKAYTTLDPSASVAWDVDRETFFPRGSVLTSLRLRGAFGRGYPMHRDQIPYGISLYPVSLPGVIPSRTREIEVGLDAGFAQQRIELQLGDYDALTDHAFETVPGPPSNGFTNYAANAYAVSNRGVEALVRANILRSSRIRWDGSLSAATNRNERGAGVAYLVTDIVQGVSIHRVAGYPLDGLWARPMLTWADKNGDGRITRACTAQQATAAGAACEVTVGDSAVYLGSTLPMREQSLSSRLTLFGTLTVSALVDHRSGFKQVNSTELRRCTLSPRNCRALYDPTASLADQARAVAAASRLSSAGYVEDAAFWKLREVTIELAAPTQWSTRLHARHVTLTLAGRNLATWTRYRGLDPEMNSDGQRSLGSTDLLTQPPVRTYTARVTLGW